jgi:hypothetical protein
MLKAESNLLSIEFLFVGEPRKRISEHYGEASTTRSAHLV